MAWEDEVVLIARTLLQDTAATPKYSDDAILTMSLVGAIKVGLRRKFLASYAVDVDNQLITPDPTTAAHRDVPFVMFAAYTTVLDFLRAEVRAGVSSVSRIKDGRSELGFSRDPDTIKTLLDQYEGELEDLADSYDSGRAREAMGGIVSSHAFLLPILRGTPWGDPKCS